MSSTIVITGLESLPLEEQIKALKDRLCLRDAQIEGVQRERDELRAKLEAYEKGWCCIEDPPKKKGWYLLRRNHPISIRSEIFCDDGNWFIDIEKGWRWYPLPGAKE